LGVDHRHKAENPFKEQLRKTQSDRLLAGRNRQAVATFLANHAETRIAGYRLVRIRHGRWGAAEFKVVETEEASGQAN
jgi:hypothetical protein